MGSGLNKCFISNQSLPEEIPVVVFPIIQEKGLSKVKITKNNKSHKVDQSGSVPVGHNCFYKFQGLYFTGLNKDGSKILLDENSHNKQSLILLCQYLYNEAFVGDCEDDTFNFKNILINHNIVLGKNSKEEIRFFSLDDEKTLKSFNQTTVNEIFNLIIEYSSKNMIYVSDTV